MPLNPVQLAELNHNIINEELGKPQPEFSALSADIQAAHARAMVLTRAQIVADIRSTQAEQPVKQ